jgi:peptidoglycan/LPS O-acetylase OafA/YrhL
LWRKTFFGRLSGLNNPDAKTPRGQMDALTGLRGFAALWVASLHFSGEASLLAPAAVSVQWFTRAGFNAVAMFFILSGFILLHTYRDRFEVFSWSEYFRFIGLRLARIYPAYLAALTAMVVLVLAASFAGVAHSPIGYPPAWLLPEALMLHAWWPDTIVTRSAPGGHFSGWNFPDWSVSVEWFAYLFIFPLAVWLLKRMAGRGKVLVAGLAVIFLVLESAIRTDWELSMVSLLFLVGALLWEFRRRTLAAGRNLPRHLDSISFLLLLSLLWFAPAADRFPFAPFVLLAIALLILGLSRADGLVSRFLASVPMVFLGEISYSIYLTHGIVLRLLKIVLPAAKYSHAALPVRVGVLAGFGVSVLLAAVALYFLVEHPARVWLRRKFSRSQTQR